MSCSATSPQKCQREKFQSPTTCLKLRLLGEISITSDMQLTPPLWAEGEEELKSLLMKVKEESEKVGLKQHSEN